MKRMDGMVGTAANAAYTRRARDWLQRPYFWSKKLERPESRAPEELHTRSEREFLNPDAALLKLASVETGRHNDSFQRTDSRWSSKEEMAKWSRVDIASFARRRFVLFCFAVTWINNDRASVSSSSRRASPRIDKTETTTMKITTLSLIKWCAIKWRVPQCQKIQLVTWRERQGVNCVATIISSSPTANFCPSAKKWDESVGSRASSG